MGITELAKTPGYIYGAGYCMGLFLYIHFRKKRFGMAVTFLFMMLAVLVIEGWMYLTRDIKTIYFMPCVCVTICILLIFQYLICKGSLRETAYYMLMAFLIGEFGASLEWQLYYFAVQNLGIRTNIGNSCIFLITVLFAVYVFFYLIEKHLAGKHVERNIRWRDTGSAFVIVATVFCLSNVSYVYENTPFSSSFTSEFFIIRTLVDLGGVCILYAYYTQMQEMSMQIEIETLQNLLQMQYQNYKVSEDSVAMVNQKYHDLKHQIAFLKTEITQEEKLSYLNQMEQEIKSYEAQNKTGNNVLDTILTAKSFQCQKLGIKMICVADGSLLSFMHPMDINALFGNALENAMECVTKIKEEEQRLIQVSVARQKDFLTICIANTCKEQMKFRQGLPVTNKKDKHYHGFGVKSIQSIANKYNGSMTVHLEHDWFELRVLIPLEEKR